MHQATIINSFSCIPFLWKLQLINLKYLSLTDVMFENVCSSMFRKIFILCKNFAFYSKFIYIVRFFLGRLVNFDCWPQRVSKDLISISSSKLLFADSIKLNEVWKQNKSDLWTCHFLQTDHPFFTMKKQVLIQNITLTSPCNLDPREPHLYTVKLGFSGVYIMSSFSAFLLFLMEFCFEHDLFIVFV